MYYIIEKAPHPWAFLPGKALGGVRKNAPRPPRFPASPGANLGQKSARPAKNFSALAPARGWRTPTRQRDARVEG